MAKLVSTTYGEALFELAVEEGREDEFLSEVDQLKSLLDANPDFGKLMNHPKCNITSSHIPVCRIRIVCQHGKIPQLIQRKNNFYPWNFF